MPRPDLGEGIAAAKEAMEAAQALGPPPGTEGWIAADGRLVEVAGAGVAVDGEPVWDLRVERTVPSGGTITVRCRQALPRLLAGAFVAGAGVRILSPPGDPTRVVVTGLCRATTTMEAYNDAAVASRLPPRQDPADRLTRLKELHEKGLLTDEEYRDRRARIIDEL
jgi:hypothetical protein